MQHQDLLCTVRTHSLNPGLRFKTIRLIAALGVAAGAGVLSGFDASTVEASILRTGDVSPSSGITDPWDTGSDYLEVGETGTGSLTIDNSSDVISRGGYIGYRAGSNGTVSISDPGSTWSNQYSLYVGDEGTGELTISNGAYVANTTGYIGYDTGSSGTATVTGTNSTWNNTSSLYVGRYGEAELTIESGASVNNTSCYIGYYSEGSGTVTVQGNGSATHWNNDGTLTVGRAGSGTMNIYSQGMVYNRAGIVGDLAGSSGTVVMNGTDTIWINDYALTVGRAGSGLVQTAPGAVIYSNGAYLGEEAGSDGTVIIAYHATWNNTGSLTIGQAGTGLLDYGNGGTVNVTQDTIVDENGEGNGTIEFGGGVLNTSGLRASSSDLLGIGTINTGSIVSDIDLVFDAGSGLQRDIVLNSLPGQDVTIHIDASGNTGEMGAGYKGTGTLTIRDGLSVSSTTGYLGYFASADGTATVSGNGSTWDNSGDLYVGRAGSGMLIVEDGGTVINATAYLDSTSGLTSTATVTGANSLWQSYGELYIGQEGTGTLTIASGGTVEVAYNTVAGRYEYGTGVIHFDQGTLNTGGLLASPEELTGVGTINSSGLVSDVDLRFDASTGYQAQVVLDSLPGQNITINVDASGLTDGILLGAGCRGTGTLSVADGINTSSAYGILGYYAGSNGTANISGSSTGWSISEDMFVGLSGTGTLNISGGASVSNYYGIIGSEAGSFGTVTVSGASSTWDSSGDLLIGLSGTGTLNIVNGASVSSGSSLIGANAGSVGTVNVHGAGSSWDSSIVLSVGSFGMGVVQISDGGTVTANFGQIGPEVDSVGAVTVQGAGSSVDMANMLTVGGNGTGTLTILGGGTVSNTGAFIGQAEGSTGTASISGEGSTWSSSQSLYVGLYGVGTLNIQHGGTVGVGDELVIANRASSLGTVNLVDGVLDLNGGGIRAGEGVATFNFHGGTLKNAATIDLGEALTQSGGTLAPGGSIGQTDIVGGYVLNGGAVEIEVGGDGNTHDVVNVSGGDVVIADIGTTLELLPLGSMSAGTYTLIETDQALIGTFENVTGIGAFEGMVDVLYSSSAVQLVLNWDYVYGDIDGDGFVGLADLDVVLSQWNQEVTPGDLAAGDYSGDGFIGLDDLDVVLSNWNQGTPPMDVAVPEPGSMAVLAGGLLGVMRRKR